MAKLSDYMFELDFDKLRNIRVWYEIIDKVKKLEEENEKLQDQLSKKKQTENKVGDLLDVIVSFKKSMTSIQQEVCFLQVSL
jgi:DNA-binding protein YbaB